MDSIKPSPIKYKAFMHEKDSHTEDIKKVYDEFIKDYNLSVIRDIDTSDLEKVIRQWIKYILMFL